MDGIGPIDPALARDLARAAATNPKTTWCVTVTDEQGHATGHGCARPEPTNHTRPAGRPRAEPPAAPTCPVTITRPAGPGAPHRQDLPSPPPARTAHPADTAAGGSLPGYRGTGVPGQRALMIALDPIALETCDHRFEARGHDPGVKLRHLAQIRHATCTGPTCRRPSATCDFEHNIPYEAGGRSCLCNGAAAERSPAGCSRPAVRRASPHRWRAVSIAAACSNSVSTPVITPVRGWRWPGS